MSGFLKSDISSRTIIASLAYASKVSKLDFNFTISIPIFKGGDGLPLKFVGNKTILLDDSLFDDLKGEESDKSRYPKVKIQNPENTSINGQVISN